MVEYWINIYQHHIYQGVFGWNYPASILKSPVYIWTNAVQGDLWNSKDSSESGPIANSAWNTFQHLSSHLTSGYFGFNDWILHHTLGHRIFTASQPRGAATGGCSADAKALPCHKLRRMDGNAFKFISDWAIYIFKWSMMHVLFFFSWFVATPLGPSSPWMWRLF